MIIHGARVEGDDEDERGKIERIVDKPLVEKPDGIHEDADRRHGEP
jgi:hypothetical protein